MGNFDSSMGFSVNEDGSITRTDILDGQQVKSPVFIPTSVSKFKGGFGKKVVFNFIFLILLLVNAFTIGVLIDRWVCGGHIVILPFLISMILTILLGRPLIKSYPCKRHILRCADYVQENLKFNYGFPYIMTNNHIGVLNTKKKKIIIPPDYDVIYWVVPRNVLCAVKDDEQTFYDTNGNILQNVPSSYYTTRTTI